MSPDTQANCEGRRCEDERGIMRVISHMQRRPAASVVFFVDVDGAFAHSASVVERYQPQNRVDVAVPACNVQRRHGFYLRIAYNHSFLQEALQNASVLKRCLALAAASGGGRRLQTGGKGGVVEGNFRAEFWYFFYCRRTATDTSPLSVVARSAPCNSFLGRAAIGRRQSCWYYSCDVQDGYCARR